MKITPLAKLRDKTNIELVGMIKRLEFHILEQDKLPKNFFIGKMGFDKYIKVQREFIKVFNITNDTYYRIYLEEIRDKDGKIIKDDK